MRNLLSCWTRNSALVLGLSFAAAGSAAAQATAAADRGAEVAPFFQTTMLSPDWGASRNYGYSVGLDYTRLSMGIGQAAFEVRYTSASGLRVDETSYGGGLGQFQGSAFHMHPYATVLAGMGNINIHPNGPTQLTSSSFMYAMGGGLEANVHTNFKLRVDALQETWSFAPHKLTPILTSIGLTYVLPFGAGSSR